MIIAISFCLFVCLFVISLLHMVRHIIQGDSKKVSNFTHPFYPKVGYNYSLLNFKGADGIFISEPHRLIKKRIAALR